MNSSGRNIDIIEHIINYCNEISLTHERFEHSINIFNEDVVYRMQYLCAYFKLKNYLNIYLRISKKDIIKFHGIV